MRIRNIHIYTVRALFFADNIRIYNKKYVNLSCVNRTLTSLEVTYNQSSEKSALSVILANANNKTTHSRGLVQVLVTVTHNKMSLILQNVIAFYRTRIRIF